jgi:hypothetical protein
MAKALFGSLATTWLPREIAVQRTFGGNLSQFVARFNGTASQPCQGWGRGFESHRLFQISQNYQSLVETPPERRFYFSVMVSTWCPPPHAPRSLRHRHHRGVNAGEKMHRRAGVKMHYRRRSAMANFAFRFD